MAHRLGRGGRQGRAQAGPQPPPPLITTPTTIPELADLYRLLAVIRALRDAVEDYANTARPRSSDAVQGDDIASLAQLWPNTPFSTAAWFPPPVTGQVNVGDVAVPLANPPTGSYYGVMRTKLASLGCGSADALSLRQWSLGGNAAVHRSTLDVWIYSFEETFGRLPATYWATRQLWREAACFLAGVKPLKENWAILCGPAGRWLQLDDGEGLVKPQAAGLIGRGALVTGNPRSIIA